MFDKCFSFSPRDSIPGLISKICKYLKDHPGWSEKELEEQIKKFISSTGVESFNGRTGVVTLDKNDVNIPFFVKMLVFQLVLYIWNHSFFQDSYQQIEVFQQVY